MRYILTTIEPPSRGTNFHWREWWEYRELLYFLTWRDIKVKYKQTVLGVLWAFIQPLSTMIVFSVFFGRLAQVPSGDIPYPLFSYVGLIPWVFFSNGMTLASNSLIGNTNLLTKVYFPRFMMPFASIFSGTIDFVIAFSATFLLLIIFGAKPSATILFSPILLILLIFVTFGMSLWSSALNVRYRDVRYIVPFLLQIWLFVTPIAYSIQMIPYPWVYIYSLNPMVGVVEGFRWAVFGTVFPLGSLCISFVITSILLITGMRFFQNMENSFADEA